MRSCTMCSAGSVAACLLGYRGKYVSRIAPRISSLTLAHVALIGPLLVRSPQSAVRSPKQTSFIFLFWTADCGLRTADCLSVQLRRDDVQAAQHRHHVAQLMADHQVRERGEVDERRRTGTGAVGGAAAVR